LYAIVAELEAAFPGRPFTPDGHLVGSIGEVLAAHHYELALLPCSAVAHDATAADGRLVQIKATQGTLVGLRACPEHLIVLRILPNGAAEEIYNGPGILAWARAGKLQKNGQRPISATTLRVLMAQIPEAARLPLMHPWAMANTQEHTVELVSAREPRLEAAAAIADYCIANLNLADARPSTEHYQSLPLCVIDAVFSIGVNYAGTAKVVRRFGAHFGMPCLGTEAEPPTANQLSTSDFLALYARHGIPYFTDTIYQNRQRTSTTSGILKADAVLRFSEVLHRFQVEYLQDVARVCGQSAFETAIMQLPGQSSGVCLRYFYMLTGSDAYIKPDRMILRFIEAATGRWMTVVEAHVAVVEAHQLLQPSYAQLTLRMLDNLIWQYQRTQ
jgi:hypothetical protein